MFKLIIILIILLVLILLLNNNSTSGFSSNTTNNKYKIIVAKYNEDIDWLLVDNNVIVYNKGKKLLSEGFNGKLVKNVGREAETYLHYIIDNYDDLPDVLIFTQGNITDHLVDKYKGLNSLEYLIELKNEALHYKKSNNYFIYDDLLENDIVKRKSFSPKWNNDNNKWYLDAHYKNNKYVYFDDWFKKNIQNDYPNPMNIYIGAIFAVSKELVLNNSLEYYKILISLVNWDSNPVEAHFFERSWYYIFK